LDNEAPINIGIRTTNTITVNKLYLIFLITYPPFFLIKKCHRKTTSLGGGPTNLLFPPEMLSIPEPYTLIIHDVFTLFHDTCYLGAPPVGM
jgi:hypothetical protein